MEFFVQDPAIPRLPPQDVRLLDLCAESYPDRSRIRVTLELTPFQEKPCIELALVDEGGELLGSTSVIEPVATRLELTMHLRRAGLFAGNLTLTARVTYPERDMDVDSRALTFAMAGD